MMLIGSPQIQINRKYFFEDLRENSSILEIAEYVSQRLTAFLGY